MNLERIDRLPARWGVRRHIDLPIELQRPRLQRERMGSEPRTRRPVDDADTNAKAGQPEGMRQASRAGAGDQDFGRDGSAWVSG